MDFSELKSYLDNLKNYGIPACDITVWKNHECLFRYMTGYSDYEKTKPVRKEDLYNVFSNTKIFTVVSTMQLVEQGKIKLQDKLSDYLPAFKDMKVLKEGKEVSAKNEITIFNLLTMTAGLSYESYKDAEQYLLEKGKDAKLPETVSLFAKAPLYFEPASSWKYSRCHDVLAGVVEKVSGLKYGEYLKKNIFEPLGIKRACFSGYDKKSVSALYTYDNDSRTSSPYVNDSSFEYSENYESGGGGLIAGTDDVILLLDALANNGVGKTGARILKKETIDEIKKNRLTEKQFEDFQKSHHKVGYGYGLGVRTLIDKSFGAKSSIGEFGWDGMTGGYELVDTDNNIAICYMQNVHNCGYAWFKIFPETRDIVYGIIERG